MAFVRLTGWAKLPAAADDMMRWPRATLPTGLIHLRVPTWCPFRLQFYCNGHSWLARQLAAAGIAFTLADNAFTRIGDFTRAQQLADNFSPDRLHDILDRYAEQCCPLLDVFGQTYCWSITQVEYSTDLVFRSPKILQPLYQQLCRQAVLSVKAEHIATFLGHQITPNLVQEVGNQFSTCIEGTCIKHHYGRSTVKTTSPFSSTTGRWNVDTVHPQGNSPRSRSPFTASGTCAASCSGAISSISPIWLRSTTSPQASERWTGSRGSAPPNGKSVKPINFFSPVDQNLLRALHRPAFNIAGMRRADLSSP
jgi:hypothetical protein